MSAGRRIARGMDRHKELMKEALVEAAKGRGRTFPNPAVGAVVARGGRIVGRGFHKRWGRPHAEVEALRDAASRARGADLYVTLEPCSHWGRTPPCTEAIVRSGVKRVFVPCIDPNPLVKGAGLRALRRAGVEVVSGVGRAEARRLNEAYFKFMRTGRPFVTLKIAQTLDGKIATRTGEARWVTSPQSRRLGKAMRAEAQAVLVGVNTVISDDPGLMPVPRRRTFYRCVLDTHLSIPIRSRVVKSARIHPTMVYCADPPDRKVARLEEKGVLVRRVQAGPDRLVRVEQVAADLGCQGVMHVLVEGGSKVSSSFLKAGIVDKIVAFIAPKVLGDVNGLATFSEIDAESLEASYVFSMEEMDRVGDDAMIVLYPRRRRGTVTAVRKPGGQGLV